MYWPRLFSLLPFVSPALGSAIISPASRADLGLGGNNYPVSVVRASGPTAGFGFTHAANSEYTATIYVNGIPFQVVLDTGSADTWIDPDSIGGIVPPNVISTGMNSTTTYLDGTVSTGEIVLADVSFGPYTVKNQALTFSYGAAKGKWNGLIGLGGSSQSKIFQLMANTTFAENSKAILYNLFDNEPDMPNYIAFLMSRSDIGIGDGGVLTVSEVLSNMTDVLSAPVLESPMSGRWMGYLQSVTVNGQVMAVHSNVTDFYQQEYNLTIPKDNAIAIFDTGTSLMYAPESYADLIYANVPDAQPQNLSDGSIIYQVPCDTKLNITFTFAGRDYPIHPLDAVIVFAVDETGPACVGSVQAGPVPTGDWLLGSAFLRNTYTVYDYGMSVPSTRFSGNLSSTASHPRTQLLSIVDRDQAWAEVDEMFARRLAAYQQDYSSTYTLPPPTAGTVRPTYTGTVASVSLTSADSSATVTVSANASVNAAVAGAFASDDVTSASGVNLSALMRNSWIVIGMLCGVLVLLIAVLVSTSKANRRTREYRPLGGYTDSAPYGQ